jgi:hypothetical protein
MHEQIARERANARHLEHVQTARISGELRDPVFVRPGAVRSWFDVGCALVTMPHGAQLAFARMALPHPAYEGAERSLGMPRGQNRDWRFPPDANGRGLHVHEHERAWIAHLDARHPSVDPWGHLVRDVL